MLLFRRIINITAAGAGDAEIPLVASLYRESVDAGYGALVAHYADIGMFDEYLLMVLEAVLKTGRYLEYGNADPVVPISI